MNNKRKLHISPMLKIVLCFICIIIIGGLILKLPISIQKGQKLAWVDAFFTSTSAVCVTGLSPINVGVVLSKFGQVVLALLIQIGGIGFVTFAVFVMIMLGMKIGISDRTLLKEALNQNSHQGLVKLVIRIIITSLVIELLGAIINFIVFIQEFSFWEAVHQSLFLSISAFNNAGFDVFVTGNSLMNYSGNILLNINICLLITLGGLGFIVINDIITNKRWKNLSMHSKIVLITTFSLIVSGTLFIFISQAFSDYKITFLEAIFQCITCRTAGFYTIDLKSLTMFSMIISLTLMFIGASPCSTGGGIKTTTLFVMLKSVKGFASGKTSIAFHRKIGSQTKIKAFTLTTIAIASIGFFSLIISFIEQFNTTHTPTFIQIIFETVSAFGTVGSSLGLTSQLLPLSKIFLCLLMFLGRVGALTLFSLWNKNWNNPNNETVKYVEEKFIIG